jgi:hypothetical protein
MMCNVDTQECTMCHEVKSLADFYFYKRDGKQGSPYRYCKVCHNARTRRWHKENPDVRRESNWKTREISCTVEQYEQMMQEQDSVCAICEMPEPSGRNLAVDHSHETGEVRGLLCTLCNVTVGKFEGGRIPLNRFLHYMSPEEDKPNGTFT